MVKTIDHKAARDQAINIRATRQERDLIDQAAQMQGKSRSEFMLDSACREAEDVVLDRVFFRLSPDIHDHVLSILDNPPAPSAQLRSLLARQSPWE